MRSFSPAKSREFFPAVDGTAVALPKAMTGDDTTDIDANEFPKHKESAVDHDSIIVNGKRIRIRL